jgi:hypothetical protein
VGEVYLKGVDLVIEDWVRQDLELGLVGGKVAFDVSGTVIPDQIADDPLLNFPCSAASVLQQWAWGVSHHTVQAGHEAVMTTGELVDGLAAAEAASGVMDEPVVESVHEVEEQATVEVVAEVVAPLMDQAGQAEQGTCSL